MLTVYSKHIASGGLATVFVNYKQIVSRGFPMVLENCQQIVSDGFAIVLENFEAYGRERHRFGTDVAH